MSDARSFAQDNTEKTPEERLALLEAKIPSYQDRIAAYDALFDEMHALVLKIEMEKEKTDGYKKAIDSLGENVAKLHNLQVERVNGLQSDLIEHAGTSAKIISGQSDIQGSVTKMLDDVKGGMATLKKTQDEALATKANAAEVGALQVTINKNAAQHAQMFNDLRKSVDGIVSQLESDIKSTKDNSISPAAFISSIDLINTQVTALKADSANSKAALPSVSLQLECKIAKAIDDLRNELTSKPSDLVDFKNDILKKLEAIALDASSANLRSQNSDKKVFLLEKQLENAQLLIKKLELK